MSSHSLALETSQAGISLPGVAYPEWWDPAVDDTTAAWTLRYNLTDCFYAACAAGQLKAAAGVIAAIEAVFDPDEPQSQEERKACLGLLTSLRMRLLVAD